MAAIPWKKFRAETVEAMNAHARLAMAEELIGVLVRELRRHTHCGDAYPDSGWPSVNAALAAHASYKRLFPRRRRRGTR